MHPHLIVMPALVLGLLAALPRTGQPLWAQEPSQVTAIDILLDPDATMVRRAQADNERLRKVFPKGFALGQEHQPHISCLQRYVRTADLDKIYAAVSNVLAEEKPAAWKLKAYQYYYVPWKEIGLAGIDDRQGAPSDNALVAIVQLLRTDLSWRWLKAVTESANRPPTGRKWLERAPRSI